MTGTYRKVKSRQLLSSTMFKLRSTLTGHEQDVRSITAFSDEAVVSGSRDGTVRSWNVKFNLDVNAENEICFLSPTGQFINAVTAVTGDPSEPLVAIGGKDAVIYLSGIHDSFAKPGDDFGKYQLPGHQGNVCSLNYQDGLLASGSWDCTAKVWDLSLFSLKYDLVGHSASVWDAKIVDSETILTCSADRTIRKWVRGREVQQYAGHEDVVRKLLILPGGDRFVSASNDCTLKIWDLSSGTLLETLQGHQSFIYDVAVLSNGDLVSTAEDRSVRIWRDGKTLQAITLPCISVWCVAVFPDDDIAVGGSDKQVYVFTRDDARAATQSGIEEFNLLVRLSAISEQSLDDLKKTDIPGYDRLSRPGKEEGSTIMVKSPAGVIEAHQWSGGEWIKIGDVVNSAAGSTGKQQYNGKEYDYVFDVDIEDGKPPLKLPYNANENPYTAAQRFLADNELPGSYADEVVRFINLNTSGFQLDQQAGGAAGPAPTATSAQNAEPASTLLPQTTPITFKDYKPEQLIRGFAKYNAAQGENAFSTQIARKVESSLADLKSKSAIFLITEVIPKILSNSELSQKLIGFDMLRISIPRVTTVDLLQSTDAAESILSTLTKSVPQLTANDISLVMMIFKVMCNLTTSVLFAQVFLTVDDAGKMELNSFFDEFATSVISLVSTITSSEARSHKHFSQAATAIASFLYDLSVYVLTNKNLGSNPRSLTIAATLLDKVGDALVPVDEESAYRLCVTYGNLKGAKVVNTVPGWMANSKEKYTTGRFTEIYREIDRF